MQPETSFVRLIEAVLANNLDDVKAIIAQEADVVKLTDNFSWNALHYATFLNGSRSLEPAPLDPEASEENLKIIKALVEAGADLDATNIKGETSLDLAISAANKVQAVKVLIEAGANPKDSLHKAAKELCPDIVEAILKTGKVDVNALDKDGDTALKKAFDYHYNDLKIKATEKVVEHLLDYGANPNLVDKDLNPALVNAVRFPKFKAPLIELLLAKNAQIDKAGKHGNTPLHYATLYGNLEVAKLLLENGASFDLLNNEGKTALQIIDGKQAPHAKDLITAKILLEKGADLEKIGKGSKLYPLLKIIGNLNDDEIKVLANNLEDFKVISNGILIFKNFSEKESGPIQELTNDIMSMILVNSFPINLKEGMGEDLTSKLVKNLLEMHSNDSKNLSPETSPSAQSSQADSATEAPRSPSPEARAQGTDQLAPKSSRDRT